MRFIETIKNIFRIEELRTRLGFTLLMVLIYRMGCYVVLPGVDVNALDNLTAQTSGGLMALLDMFSGGAFSNASIFALGIMPYISASIIIQLLGMVLPSFQKKQRDENGRRILNKYTRYLTIAVLILQGWAYLSNLGNQLGGAVPDTTFFKVTSIIIMCAGSMFVLWLGERITDKGIGNGISFIIMVGILARFPRAIMGEYSSRYASAGGLFMFLMEFVFLVLVVALAVMLVQGVRKVPIQYAKRIEGNRQVGGVRQYLPLKVNAANVMPIIFAQALMMIPMVVAGFSTEGNAFTMAMTDSNGFWYNLVFFILIILFTYFYTALTVNPQQIAESLKKSQGFVPGVKPGKPTQDYINEIMERITLPGSIFLGIVAILPAFASKFGVSQAFAQFFGGTSLLIMVGVVLDTLQQIESYLLMRHYDGLMKNGRIKGRTGSMAAY
ncbi:MAG: preprotein translocase subunit SecY [Paludibacteraceae bacterium]|nr:preprotein translocase subunit SecY [Paludibacteraceae bacterium]